MEETILEILCILIVAITLFMIRKYVFLSWI